MATYVFCQRPSDSAKELCDALDAFRIRRFDGMNFWRKTRRVNLKEGDVVICWGESFPDDLEGIRVLNGADVGGKYEQAVKLAQEGTPTINVLKRNTCPAGMWIPRRDNHVGGSDLLRPPVNPDYYVERLGILEEYRIHAFKRRSIRAGIKVVRDGFTLDGAVAAANPQIQLASSWVRSYDGGWRVRYDQFQATPRMRRVAYNAVSALGLDFGAVDLAKIGHNTYVVLEVNRAPGLEGGSITAYANRIKNWIEQGPEEEPDNVVDTERNEGVAERTENPAPPPAPATIQLGQVNPTPTQVDWGDWVINDPESLTMEQQIRITDLQRRARIAALVQRERERINPAERLNRINQRG